VARDLGSFCEQTGTPTNEDVAFDGVLKKGADRSRGHLQLAFDQPVLFCPRARFGFYMDRVCLRRRCCEEQHRCAYPDRCDDTRDIARTDACQDLVPEHWFLPSGRAWPISVPNDFWSSVPRPAPPRNPRCSRALPPLHPVPNRCERLRSIAELS